MIEDQDDMGSGREPIAKMSPSREGNVVSLAAHRRWRKEKSYLSTDFQPAFELLKCEPDWLEEGWLEEHWVEESWIEEKATVATGPEPGLWLVLVASLLAFAFIIALYWAYVTGVRALAHLSFNLV